jgi:acyl carrier protein
MEHWIDEVLFDIAITKKNISLDPNIVELAVKNANLLWEDLGFDSLDVMEAIIECEGITGVTIPNYMIKDIKTKSDIVELFEKMAKNG